MATDLTWQEILTELPANSVTISDGTTPLTAGAYIDLSTLTGDSITALTNNGVIETVVKLIQAGLRAQATINDGVSAGSQLNAFLTPTTTAPTVATDGTINTDITFRVFARASTNLDDVVGTQV